MSLMRSETLEAPDAVARCLAQKTAFADIGARLRALDPPFVVVGARGSSGHAGTYLLTPSSRMNATWSWMFPPARKKASPRRRVCWRRSPLRWRWSMRGPR
jgi:hypothetical protein